MNQVGWKMPLTEPLPGAIALDRDLAGPREVPLRRAAADRHAVLAVADVDEAIRRLAVLADQVIDEAEFGQGRGLDGHGSSRKRRP